MKPEASPVILSSRTRVSRCKGERRSGSEPARSSQDAKRATVTAAKDTKDATVKAAKDTKSAAKKLVKKDTTKYP